MHCALFLKVFYKILKREFYLANLNQYNLNFKKRQSVAWYLAFVVKILRGVSFHFKCEHNRV